jgi:hypothetical protein
VSSHSYFLDKRYTYIYCLAVFVTTTTITTTTITTTTTTTTTTNNNNNNKYLLTAVGSIPGGSGYFICIQNMTMDTTKLKSGGLHEKQVVASWKVGNHLSICF